MNFGSTTLHLIVILLAARLAAEVAERLRAPGVLAEILAGVLIGPSVAGLVRADDFLRTVAQIGALLLLFEVGMSMHVSELVRAGGDSLRIAFLGVTLTIVAADLAMRGFGLSPTAALFVAAGISATSIGITARVLADLRALQTREAHTILGAAVADDVIGLALLAIVIRASAQGGLHVSAVATTVLVAVVFVIGGVVLGVAVAGRAFERIVAWARAPGMLVVLGFAVALGFARLAVLAKLAPIVGAFVAGVTMSRGRYRDELRRELEPIGYLLIPVFFVLIGVDVRLRVFKSGSAIAIALALVAITIAARLAASFGSLHARRSAVGAGMIPRGEVTLIFAGYGLAHGIIDERMYGALVFVVLATTLITPWLLRREMKARGG